MHGYPAGDHPIRRMVMGLDSPPAFSVPPFALLEKLSQSDGSAEARTHKLLDEILQPPRPPVSYLEAKAAIFDITGPRLDQSDEERAVARELNLACLEFFARIDKYVEGRERDKRASLEQKHADVYAGCRALSDKVSHLQYAVGRATTLLMPLDDKRSRAQTVRDNADAQRPTNYPSVQELDAWKATVEAAEAALVAAKKDYADSKESLDQIQWEFTNAQGELAQLESEEKKLLEILEKLRKGDQ